MIKIRCVIEHITYQNPENGYSVMKAQVKGYREPVTLVGKLEDGQEIRRSVHGGELGGSDARHSLWH